MFRSLLASALFVVLGASPTLASASYVFSTTGIGTRVLTPSADSLSLNANAGMASLGNFSLQTGVFSVGDSDNLSGTFAYIFNESVTIGGQTKVVPISVRLIVTNQTQSNLDTLAILISSAPVLFSDPGVNFSINSFQSAGYGVGQSTNFFLTANLTEAESVPEPASFALAGAALVGLAVSGRGRKRR